MMKKRPILLLSIIMLLYGCTTVVSPSEKHYYNGNTFYDAGQYDAAITEYKKFLDANVRSSFTTPVKLNLGMSYYYSGQTKEAYDLLKDIRIDDPSLKSYVDKVLKKCELTLGLEAPAVPLEAGDIAINVLDASLDDFGSITIIGRTDKPAKVTVNGTQATLKGNNRFEASLSFRRGESIDIEAKYGQGNYGDLKYYPDREAPLQPENLRTVNVTSNSVEFEWDENSDPDIYGYKIFYGLKGGSSQEVNEIVRSTDYEVVGLHNLIRGANKTFEFYVKAIDKMRNYSLSSDILEVTLP